jgi:hypothetical protein
MVCSSCTHPEQSASFAASGVKTQAKKCAFKMRLDGGRCAPAKLLPPKTRLEGPAPP